MTHRRHNGFNTSIGSSIAGLGQAFLNSKRSALTPLERATALSGLDRSDALTAASQAAARKSGAEASAVETENAFRGGLETLFTGARDTVATPAQARTQLTPAGPTVGAGARVDDLSAGLRDTAFRDAALNAAIGGIGTDVDAGNLSEQIALITALAGGNLDDTTRRAVGAGRNVPLDTVFSTADQDRVRADRAGAAIDVRNAQPETFTELRARVAGGLPGDEQRAIALGAGLLAPEAIATPGGEVVGVPRFGVEGPLAGGGVPISAQVAGANVEGLKLGGRDNDELTGKIFAGRFKNTVDSIERRLTNPDTGQLDNARLAAPGAFARIATDIKAQAVGFATTLGIDPGTLGEDISLGETVLRQDKFKELAKANVEIRGALIELAYAKIIAEQGTRPTDTDFDNAFRTLGAELGDAEILMGNLRAIGTRLDQNIQTEAAIRAGETPPDFSLAAERAGAAAEDEDLSGASPDELLRALLEELQ